MHNSGNAFRLGLMVISILLLVVLQCLWLLSSYENALTNFTKETSIIFRTTVFDMRDSIFAKNIRPLKNSESGRQDTSSLKITTVNRLYRDTLITNDSLLRRASKIQVFITATDSMSPYLTPLVSAIHRYKGKPNFVLRLGSDTLDVNNIAAQYATALNSSEINARFIVRRDIVEPVELGIRSDRFQQKAASNEIRTQQLFEDTVVVDRVHINPVDAYVAVFPDVRMIVLRQIRPQIFFSLFLTMITVTAFVILFRNIGVQQRLMIMKNDFISNVTHELKTPLATISVALEAMKDFHVLEDSEKTKDYLAIAQNELNRLTLMTDKILNASVVESEGSKFSVELINLKNIFDHVLSSMKLVFEKRNLRVNFQSCPGHDQFQGSEVHITNVVFNLLENAIKYGRENSVIDICLNCTEHHVGFKIADEGIGIAKEHHQKIFEKFFRVSTGDVHNTKGYGLGLSYVADVIRKHYGTIDVDSTLGKGTSFIVRLPRIHAGN